MFAPNSKSLPRLWLLLLLLSIFASASAHARSTTLVEPPLLPLPSGRTVQQAVDAVKLSLRSNPGWRLDTEESTTSLVGSFAKSRHLARLRFTVTASGVQARYHSSVNLSFEQNGDEREIHPAYNVWVESFMARVAETLAKNPAEVSASLAAATGAGTTQSDQSRAAYLDLPANNPPPSQALGTFSKLDLLAVQQLGVHPDLVQRIDANLQKHLGPVVRNWQGNSGAAGHTLRLQPQIVALSYVNASTRVWGGQHESWIVMKLRCTDASTGALVAEPQFYQRADGHGGRWTFGATDSVMLERIAKLQSAYVLDNKSQAVGGSTSLPDNLIPQ